LVHHIALLAVLLYLEMEIIFEGLEFLAGCSPLKIIIINSELNYLLAVITYSIVLKWFFMHLMATYLPVFID
jgi:hypothetical protein